jgi:RNA 3'-terminal phosphate cyclase (ATP)
VIIELEYENLTEVFTGFGEKRISSAEVVDQACTLMERYLESDAPAGEYLTDQLLLPLAIGNGGEFNSSEISPHTTTNIGIIRRFIGVDIDTVQTGRNNHTVRVRKMKKTGEEDVVDER